MILFNETKWETERLQIFILKFLCQLLIRRLFYTKPTNLTIRKVQSYLNGNKRVTTLLNPFHTTHSVEFRKSEMTSNGILSYETLPVSYHTPLIMKTFSQKSTVRSDTCLPVSRLKTCDYKKQDKVTIHIQTKRFSSYQQCLITKTFSTSARDRQTKSRMRWF